MSFLAAKGATNYPFTLSVDDTAEGFWLSAQVESSVDPERICAYMEQALGQLTEALENAPETPVSQLDILPAGERTLLLETWNDTAVSYPAERCIHELFEEQARKTPDAPAVVVEGESLSYGELDARANQLAHHLRAMGVGPDVVVGSCVERSLEMVTGLLGILKAGGAYLPLDPGYPAERLAYMLSDSAVSVLLTQQALIADLPAVSYTHLRAHET